MSIIKTNNLQEEHKKSPLHNIEKLAKLLDSKFKIPGTKYTFGIDPFLSLIPSLGTYFGFAFGSFLIIEGIRKGAKGKVLLKMMGNNFLDFAIGLIPGLGFIFDFVFKSNNRNVQLLREYFHEGKHQGNAWFYWFLIITSIIALFIFCIFIAMKIIHFAEKLILFLLP